MFTGLRLRGAGGVLAAFGALAGCNNESGQ
jgi:hypothetical protein